MSNLNELKPTTQLSPFGKFCSTIGNIPSSYMASLTYEEQLLWLCDYLQNTVIPTVNNNAEAVEELQKLFLELKNYVDNYFDNLDVQNEINYKLDKMVEDGTFYNIFSKFNNEINDLQNQIINKTQAGPRGVYNTLNDLIEENPDHNFIYVISSTNKWAYFNGETWAEGGDFLTSTFGKVSKSDTDFYDIFYNLFNKFTAQNNKYINKDNGNVLTPTDSGTFYASDFIKVEPSTPYISNNDLNNPSQYAWYDEDKTYISGGIDSNTNKNPMIPPSNAKYLRFTARNLNTIINKGAVPYSGSGYSNYYNLQLDDLNFLDTRYIKYIRTENLFNKDHCLYNYYVNEVGNVIHPIDGSIMYLSDFIPINFGENMSVYGRANFTAEFDGNYNFIKFVTTPVNTRTYTPSQSNCKYVRFMLSPTNLNTFTIVRGIKEIENYIPFYIPNIDDDSIDENMLSPDIRYKLNKVINKLYNKNISFIGDSLTYGYDGANPNNRVENPFPSIIQNNYGCFSNNLGINGSTIGGDGDNSGYLPINQRILSIDESSDIILIFGGTNDFNSNRIIPLGDINDNDNSTFYGSLKTLFNNFYNNFNCKIGFVTPLQRSNMNTLNSDNKILKDYIDAIFEVCKLYSVPVLDLFNFGNCYPLNSNFKNNNLPDGLHPNQNFYNIIADKIGSFLESL